jgi:hypothetical protein
MYRFARVSSLSSIFVALLVCMAASPALNAQLNGPINAPDACANGNLNCGHPSTSTGTQASSGPFSTFAMVAVPAVAFGVLGSFAKNPVPPGQSMGITGTLGGAGLGLLGVAAWRENKTPSKVVTVALGAAGVASAATQAWQFHEAQVRKLDNVNYVPPLESTQIKQIATVSTVAAVVGAVTEFVARKVTGAAASEKPSPSGKPSSLIRNPFIRGLSNMQLGMVRSGVSIRFGF